MLLLDGKELIEEGVGFGVPVVKYVDKTVFSSKAEVTVHKNGLGFNLVKVFTLDMVSVKKLGRAGYINDDFYTSLRKAFERLYLKHKKLKPLFNKAMEIRELLKIKTEFRKVEPRGTVTVTYNCQPSAIRIEADFSNVSLSSCQQVLLLNEQGSGVFSRYVDTSGRMLLGNEIGAWDAVAADRASLQSLKGQLSFSLRNMFGATLFRGWECTRKRFSWAGLSYSLKPSNGVFSYSIELNFKTR